MACEFIGMVWLMFDKVEVVVCFNRRNTNVLEKRLGRVAHLAPYLFILVAKVLNFMVKKTKSLEDIECISLFKSKNQQIISQYVDDMILFVKCIENNPWNVINLLELLLLINGLKSIGKNLWHIEMIRK
jgi:hypothetical protein